MSQVPESIAIIGMSGRFPKAANVAEFWDNLCQARECITFFTDEELLAAGVQPNELQHPTYVRANGFVEDIEMFDAGFFGFSPRDAEILDPQQRQFLECAWEVLEDAGYDPECAPEAIGVYAGTSMSTYAFQLYNNPELAGIVNDFQILLANDKDHLATRVAYKLNLKGPAVTVGTACSTSLVATCLAGQSLLDYQCDLALAGGVTLGIPMRRGYVYEPGGIASPDGHCRPFDARANGTVGGNGTAIVLLKRLSEAIADGDNVHAVIRGWGVNNDGSSKVGYTAPSVDGQAEAIALALAMADVEPDTVTMLEAHGTATPLGDPIEFTALCQAWRKTTQRSFCALGSVKSNVGHMDSAAGAAGLIKCVLSLMHKQIPANLHFEQPNPKIDVTTSPFFVNTKLLDWNPSCGVRRAAVSSFGIGGTNAHLIVEEAPPVSTTTPLHTQQLLLLSARSQDALDQMTQQLANHLEAHQELDLADVAYTLQTGRAEFKLRRMLLAPTSSCADVVHWLRAKDPRRLFSAVRNEKFNGVSFLLPGQGAQHPGMALGIYQSEPLYREIIDHANAILQPLLGVDLRDLLHTDSSTNDLQWTRLTQPAVFVVSYALARLWISWGVKPVSLLGHSIGEYTAACLAGVMAFDDALKVVAERGRIIEKMPTGSMLAVARSEADLRDRFPVDMAAVNGPSQCVLSGSTSDIQLVKKLLEQDRVSAHLLSTSHAFHSKLIEPAVPLLEEVLRRIPLHPPSIPYISNVTGTWIQPEEAQSPEYWGRHLRATVRFSEGLQRLVLESETLLLETGPSQTLAGLARHHSGLPAGRMVLTSCRHALETAISDEQALLQTLGRLWLTGVRIDWRSVHQHESRLRVSLPTYPFQRQRYWIDAPLPEPMLPPVQQDTDVRQLLEDWFYEPRWVRTSSLPWLGSTETWAVLGDDGVLVSALRQKLTELGQMLEPLQAEPKYVLYCMAEASLESGYYKPLHLLQQLCRGTSDQEVVFVTSEALEHAAVRGLTITAPQEYPNLRCRTIILDAAAHKLISSGHAEHIIAEAFQTGSTPWIAYRGAQRWILTYEPAPLAPVPAQGTGPLDGCYLITGGLGKIGLLFAEFLANRGARALILTSRSGHLEDQDARCERIRAIERLGTSVSIYAADAGDPEQIGTVVASARRRVGHLHGVFHAAGFTSGNAFPPFAQLDALVSEMHFQAKHRGALVLAGALADDPPEFICLLSSISTALGGLGFGAYAAANAMLDVVAEQSPLRSRWITINWDGWLFDSKDTDQNAPFIFGDEGVEALERILAATDVKQVLVSVRALEPRLEQWINPRASLRLTTSISATDKGHERPEVSADFVSPQPGRQETIAAIWRDLLGIARVGARDNFFELGGHSLLAIQVVARLRETLGRDVPVRILFDHPTVSALADALDEPDAEMLALLDKVEQMSDREVQSMLSKENSV